MTLVPDLIDPVVGFRAWRMVGGKLLSPYIPCRWDGREMHAECWPANRTLFKGKGWLEDPHESPHPDCQCGVYAYHRPGVQGYYGEWLWTEGVVTVWGQLEAHRDGLRAARARIEALALPPTNEPERRRAVQAVAEELGIPLVPRAGLSDEAARYGSPLSDGLLPAARAEGQ